MEHTTDKSENRNLRIYMTINDYKCGLFVGACQEVGEFGHSPATVADAVLLISCHLSEGGVKAFGNEDWIVAETLGPFMLMNDGSTYNTFEEMLLSLI